MAEFRYYLNRQGARGSQGPQGEKGFSPDISVEKDTLSEYVLRITNEGGYFLTSNLREHKEDRGGTYIRYDRANGVMYAGDAELATTDTLGVIRIAKDEDFAGKAEDAAVTPAQVQDYTTAKIAEVNQRVDSLDAKNVKVTGDQAIDGLKVFRDNIESNYVYTDHVYSSNGERIFLYEDVFAIGNTRKPTILYSKGSGITLNGNTDYVLTQRRVTAGDGVAIEETTNGIKISATGGGAGDVTLAGDNSFTGNNTFDGISTFNGDTWVDSLKVGTSLTNQQNKKFLAQGSITAGSDNLAISETTDGVQITCYAPTNAQIEALQRLINDLSTKIDNLTTRLNNLEEVIDGGVAGSIYPADPQKIDADPVVDSAINTGETSGSADITVEDN